MKLGIITGIQPQDIKWAADRGFKLIEMCYNDGNDPKEFKRRIDEYKSEFSKHGVGLGCLGRWGAKKFDAEGKVIQEELENQRLLIDIANQLECPVFVTNTNPVRGLSFEENCKLAIDYLGSLADYAAERGVRVCTYNCDWDSFVNSPKQWAVVQGALPSLGIKYDPSHSINRYHGDYLGEMAIWGSRIYHFHVKGTLNFGGVHVDDPPAGLDMIDWRSVMGLLYSFGYQGMLSIEPHSRVWRSGALGDWGIEYTKKYISDMIFAE